MIFIQTEVTTTGGWARSLTWKQRNTADDTATIQAQMGAFGDGATFKYWYVASRGAFTEVLSLTIQIFLL